MLCADSLIKHTYITHLKSICVWISILKFSPPLPLNHTLSTLSEVHLDGAIALPDSQFFIIVNGVQAKNKVVWQTLVDISMCK